MESLYEILNEEDLEPAERNIIETLLADLKSVSYDNLFKSKAKRCLMTIVQQYKSNIEGKISEVY